MECRNRTYSGLRVSLLFCLLLVISLVMAFHLTGSFSLAGGEITEIVVEPEEPEVERGDSLELRAWGLNEEGERIEISPEWEVAESEMGWLDLEFGQQVIFNAISEGQAVILVTFDQLEFEYTVNVLMPEMIAIEVLPEKERGERVLFADGTVRWRDVELEVGESLEFHAIGRGPAGQSVGEFEAEWELTGGIGSLSTTSGQSTVIENLQEGEGSLRARRDEVTGVAEIRVLRAASRPQQLEILPPQEQLVAGGEFEFQIKVIDQYGEEMEQEVAWTVVEGGELIGPVSSSETRLLVDDSDRLVLRAEAEGIQEEISLEAFPAPPVLDELIIEPEDPELRVGETMLFTARGRDQYGEPLDPDPGWSLIGELGRLEDGEPGEVQFTATDSGIARIEAEAEGVSTRIRFEVLERSVPQTLEISPRRQTLEPGEELELELEAVDQYGKELIPEASWSTTGEIGELTSIDGSQALFIAAADGTGTVTAQWEGQQAEAELTVSSEKELVSLVVEPRRLELAEGEERQLSAHGIDVDGNQVTIEPIWTTRGNIGRMSQLRGESSVFTASTSGEGEVVVRSGGLSTRIPVKVDSSLRLQRIEVNPGRVSLDKGETITLRATGYNEEGEEVSINPVWSLKGAVGSLSESRGERNVLEATAEGTGQLEVWSGEVMSVVQVEVVHRILSEIVIEPHDLRMRSGAREEFVVRGYDQYGDRYFFSPTWEVEGSSLRIVNEYGQRVQVQGVTPGMERLTVSSEGVETEARVGVNRLTLGFSYLPYQEPVEENLTDTDDLILLGTFPLPTGVLSYLRGPLEIEGGIGYQAGEGSIRGQMREYELLGAQESIRLHLFRGTLNPYLGFRATQLYGQLEPEALLTGYSFGGELGISLQLGRLVTYLTGGYQRHYLSSQGLSNDLQDEEYDRLFGEASIRIIF